MTQYLTIDVGGTNIKYALMDENARIEEQGSVATPRDTMENFIAAIGAIYDQYAGRIEAIAMSAPGRIDADRGYFYTSGALRYIGERDMAQVIAERCGNISFGMENDAKAAALAELWQGSMRGVKNGIVIALGTGIGGALIIDGKLYRGTTFAAGEFSCIPTDWTKMTSVEAQWSAFASTNSLVGRYAAQSKADPAALNGRVFFDKVNAGDRDALAMLNDYCTGLATGIFALQLVLDVEKVAIGGGISKQPALIDTLNKKIDETWLNAGYNPATKPVVVSCALCNDANLVGALYHYLYELEG